MSVYEVIRKLPDIPTVRDRSRAMAMLDAVLSPEWEYRYYSFQRAWTATEALASMRDGSGNDYSIVFSTAGAYARGFDHESPMSPWSHPCKTWPGLFDTVPAVFRPFVNEPAFCESDGTPRATVCFWRQASDVAWNAGNMAIPARDMGDADGAEWLFDVLVTGTAEAYRKFAKGYFDVTPDLTAVQHVYNLKPLTQEIVSALNPEVEIEDLTDDISEIGYPT